MKYLIIGEPRGDQTIKLIERGVNPSDIFVWEDSTKGQYCVRMEGATVTDNLDDFDGMKFDVVIGNPPYGSGGNLAIKFLNKCGDLSDDIRLVLPLSVRKVSSLNKIRLDLVCVEDTKLPDDTFSGGIRTVSQRWVKSDTLRDKIPTFTTHPDFEFVKKETNTANVFVMRSGHAGRVLTEGFDDYEWSHYFIKAKDQQVIDNLLAISSELVELSKLTNGMDKLSKHELVTTYMKHFD